MTLAELHERIGWQLEGRLQIRVEIPRNGVTFAYWEDVPMDCDGLTPSVNCAAVSYRRSDATKMPDEVWIQQCDLKDREQYYAYTTPSDTKDVRYVRADGIFLGKQLQHRIPGCEQWVNSSMDALEYRFKP